LQSHPFCNFKQTSCQTGESVLLYKVNYKDCNLAFLKSAEFTEAQGMQIRERPDILKPKKVQTRKAYPVLEKKLATVLMSSLSSDGMRFIRKDQQTLCGKMIYTTNYKGLYVSKEKIPDAGIVQNADVKITQYLNNKIDFAFHFNQLTIETMYSEVILNDCKLNREIFRNRLGLIFTNPNLVAPMLISENGVFGRVMGEAMFTYKCKEVAVQLIKSNVCTNELPVMFQGELRYVEPITRILVENGTKPKVLNCNEIVAPLYRINPDTWISLPNNGEVKNVEKLELTKLEYSINFTSLNQMSSNGIYSSEEVEDARRNLLFPSKRERVVIEIVDTVLPGGVGQVNYDNFFDY